MNDDIKATIDALTADPYVTEVKDLGDKLGVRHDGDEFATPGIQKTAESHGLKLLGENKDENMMVFGQ